MITRFEKTILQFAKEGVISKLKPRIVIQTKSKVVVSFDSLAASIVWIISRSKSMQGWVYDSSISAYLNDEINDFLFSVDLKCMSYSWGEHYCGFCPTESRCRYKFLQDLLVDHLLQPTSRFFSEEIFNNRYIRFVDYGGCCVAKIVKEKQLTQKECDGCFKEFYVNIFK